VELEGSVLNSTYKIGRGMQHVWGRNTFRVLVGKPEGKRPHGRPRHTWEIILK
jgi:hypothetical protein